MQSLAYLRGRRMWVVPGVSVYGTIGDAEFYYLLSEEIDSTRRLGFGMVTAGTAAQNIVYSDLVDARGNTLPASINQPKVVPISHSQYHAFIVGRESNGGFRIARDPAAPGAVTADLLIIEMG